MQPLSTIDDLHKIDMRVGRILEVRDFPEARKPAYQLTIDFGKEIGTKTSSAQITELYTRDSLRGKLIIGIINFPPRQIGPFTSEVLILGVPDDQGRVVLLKPERGVPVGERVY